MSERISIWFHRIFWGILVLVGSFLPSIIEWIKPDLDIVNHECFISNYYEGSEYWDYTDEATTCEIEVEFNRDIEYCELEIEFYDEEQKYLETENIFCFAEGNIAINSYIYVDGCVDSYEVVGWEAEYETFWYPYLSLILTLPIFVQALTLNYREIYYDGKRISVYAGFYYHRLMVNDEIVSEYNSFDSFKAIFLHATVDWEDESSDVIDVTINSLNRISLKINDKIV